MNPTSNRTIVTGILSLAVGIALGAGGMELKAANTPATKTASPPDRSASMAKTTAEPESMAPSWDPLQEIRDVQMQMDKMFNQMSTEYGQTPKFSNLVESPAYNLSLNVRDMKDRFVVRAFMPDTPVSDVNVKLDHDQTLKVDISNQQTQTTDKKNVATNVAEWGQFEQVIQLPAPVKANDMKVQRKGHELLITLPKA